MMVVVDTGNASVRGGHGVLLRVRIVDSGRSRRLLFIIDLLRMLITVMTFSDPCSDLLYRRNGGLLSHQLMLMSSEWWLKHHVGVTKRLRGKQL